MIEANTIIIWNAHNDMGIESNDRFHCEASSTFPMSIAYACQKKQQHIQKYAKLVFLTIFISTISITLYIHLFIISISTKQAKINHFKIIFSLCCVEGIININSMCFGGVSICIIYLFTQCYRHFILLERYHWFRFDGMFFCYYFISLTKFSFIQRLEMAPLQISNINV